MKHTYESITRWDLGRYTVRVWQVEQSIEEAGAPDVTDQFLLTKLIRDMMTKQFVRDVDVLAYYRDLPRTSAVEVLTANSNMGVLVYNDWP